MSFRIDQLAVLNLATVGNSITAGSFVKSGGTSSQFLKADGSVDSNAYITGITSGMVTTALGYTPVPNTRNITINGVTQDLSIDRTWTISVPVTSVSGSGAGISVSPTTGAVIVSNTGVTSNVAGGGISVSGATGAVTITNTGVTSIVAGTAISVSGATGAVTVTNTGVTSLNGSTGALTGFATQAWVTSQGYLTANQTITLSGEASGSGTTSISVTLGNSAVINKVLTGLTITGSTIASTDSILTAFGKLQNQVNGLIGGVIYQGTWNASTNSPALTSSVGTKGYYYVVSVAGSTNLNGVTDWKIGDWAIYNGSAWEKVDNTDAVSSVNGQTGAVVLSTTNIAEGTNLYYTDARARLALSFVAGSGAYNSSTGVITIPTNTNQLTNGAGFITGNQTITLSGDATGSGTTSISVTLASTGVAAGTYGGNNSIPSLVIDAKGRVTSASTVTPSGTWGISITGTAGSETLATVTGRGASTSTTLSLARVITTGLYGPSTTGNIPIWQYDASNTGYGIVYNEATPDTLRIDVSGQALTGTPDVLIGPDYIQVNGNTVWHAGNLTNLNQLINGPGYITSASVGNGTLTLAVSGSGLSGSASFTANQSGNTTFTVTSNATTAATANTLVYRDASGHITGNYGFFAYVNTSDNDETGITRFVIKNGDNYHRSATTTTAADIIRGVASGTWSINITGSAGSATNSTNTENVASGNISNLNTAWTLPGSSIGNGFRVYRYNAGATGEPVTYDNANWLINIYSHPSGGTASYGHQIAAPDTENIYFRLVTNGTFYSWRALLHSGNYNSYAPTLTGGGASGTWGINITGTAASETLATVTGRGATTATDVTFGANSTSDQGIRINYGNYVSGYGRIRFLQDGTNHSTIHSFSASWQSGTLQTASSGAINLDGQNGITIGPWNNPSVWIDNGGVAQARGSFRAPIFYDSDNTAYYLNPASGSTSLRIAGGIAQNDIVGRPAAYWGSTGTTGAVVIKFPGNTGNYGMIHAVIDIYEYNGNDACTVIVGGHNWGGAWYNYGAQVVGSTDKPVRVGVKDGQYCIVIGNGSSSWSYGQVVLRKIQNGTYYSGVMDIAGGYTVAIESDTYSWISGDLRNLETPLNFYAGSNIYMGGNIVATQSWVNSQGFVTGGPFVPSRSQSNWNDGTVIGNTVGMLAWKNYGNGHVIFDASASTSPSGSGVNNTNSQIAWSSTYPTLMGWNGSNTYGVRVDSARISDNTSGNADTVDGYHASPSNIGNYIVVRDGNGYIFGNYINMTDDGNPGGGTSISSFITKQGDNYYRSVSPTNAMVSIRGVASGSWGINITGSSSSSTTASYLPTLYAGGVQSNPQVYFGQSIGLRVAMTGVPFAWCDTLWINGYSGGDVLSMTALHTARNGQPRMWLSTQSSNGTSYGTTYEFLTEWNYTNYTLPIGGSWYGVNMPGSRWGGYAVSGGEIVFGNGLPNAGQMGMLIDGAYVAGENNGFWSLPSNNDWNGRRGMYWDGSYLNFTANSPTSVFTTLRLANGFELQQGGSNYGQFNTWVHLPGFHGLYSAQNSAHFYPNNGTYGSWMMSGSRNGWQGIEFNSGSNGNITLMVYTNSNESGFHNNSYGWQIYWAGGALYSGRNTYGGNHSRVLQEDTWISSKYFGSDGYIYGVRFSDSNDSSYFLDPNGTSELNSITTGTRARWGEPRWWHNRQAETSDQNYWTGTNGWGTSYGNWDNAWRGGFSGWDIWGTGTAHPQGSGYIHAQGIVSGQHYANSDGSAAYGWMMVGAGDATANRYWLRGKWGGSTSGWVEMITTGNIGSQNVNYASQAGTASFAASAGNTSSISSAVGGTYTWTGIQYFQSNLGGYCGSLSNPPLQAYSTGNNSAFMSFHKGGYYAVNMGLDADSVLRIGGWSAAANRWQLDMSGNMTVAGDVTAYSDARVKENVETVEDALDKVLNLRGVYYNRTDSEDKRRKVGVIAQEILEVIPEVVGQDNDGMYNVSYGNIVGVLIEAIKEQQKQIEELKARLD